MKARILAAALAATIPACGPSSTAEGPAGDTRQDAYGGADAAPGPGDVGADATDATDATDASAPDATDAADATAPDTVDGGAGLPPDAADGGAGLPPDTADGGAGLPPDPPTIVLSGYAFSFGGFGKPLAGVRVGIAELPGVETVSAEDGTWQLEVPNGAPLTPWAEAKGFELMHLQTLTGAGEPIDHVNFQMVEWPIFDMFAYALELEPDPDRCQIATTVNTLDVRDMDLADFAAYGAHGVAGAVAHTDPPLPDTVYFDEKTIPDRSLTETTIDGGVVWANVPPGVYTMTATHPTRFFAPFVATCTPGRFINAGPTRGLRELTAAEAGAR